MSFVKLINHITNCITVAGIWDYSLTLTTKKQ